MANKWTLNMAAMQEDFFSDAALIGIAAPVPAYHFCWVLNQHFDVQFVREPELDISLQSGKEQMQHHFGIYQYCAPLNGERYLLYNLKKDKQSLLPETKGLDYLWMVQSSSCETQAVQISNLLRTLPQVQMAQVLDTSRLRSLNNLLV